MVCIPPIRKDPSAKRYEQLTFEQAYAQNLRIMGLTAFTLCNENQVPIIVFDVHKKGNLAQILIEGKPNGTLVKS